MEIELNVTLKGMTTWRKGLILNDEEAPFPDSLLKEIQLKTGNIKILKEKKTVQTNTQKPDELNAKQNDGGDLEFIEDLSMEGSFDASKFVEGKLVDVKNSSLKKKITRTDIVRMNKQALIVFLGDEIQTMVKTRRELIEIATKRIGL